MAKRSTTKVVKLKALPLYTALIASGASLCPRCRTYVDKLVHDCTGEPVVTQEWRGNTVHEDHRDPIAQDWVELSAEDDNAQEAA